MYIVKWGIFITNGLTVTTDQSKNNPVVDLELKNIKTWVAIHQVQVTASAIAI